MLYKKIIVIVLVVNKVVIDVLAHSLSEVTSSNYPCKYRNITDWIVFPYGRCIQILIETNESNSRVNSEIFNQFLDTAVYMKSLSHMKHRKIFREQKTNCESFLVLSTNYQYIFNFLNSMAKVNKTERFFPFSRLYFMFSNATNLTTLQTYLHSNALFGYNLICDVRNGDIVSIQDLISNTYGRSISNVNALSHPYINTTDPNKEFTVSVFNCSPSVTYFEKIGDEYR